MSTSDEDITVLFSQGFDCSMIVFSELAADVGLTAEQGKKIASCFGMGMLHGQACGAVSGALMAIGCRYGNTKPGDMAAKGLTMTKKDEFIKWFDGEFGSITCPGVLGYDIATPEGSEMANKEQIVSTKCNHICAKAIAFAKGLL